jgi:sugar lactone lactonase YvrE
MKIQTFTKITAVALAMAATGSSADAGKPELIVTLPDHANTPDGCALSRSGEIILSVPNFNNGTLIKQGVIKKPSPAVMGVIGKNNRFSTWYKFKPEDLHPETKNIGPMDCAFGPDGNLYLADNQLFFNKAHKSRLLRINMKDGKPVGCDVVVEGFICSNGMVWHGDKLYVSETILINTPETASGQKKPKLISGVYRFTQDELTSGRVKLRPYTDQSADPHLVAKYLSSNNTGFGADGVACDASGNLYCGIFEDGVIYKTTFDNDGKPSDPVVFAKDKKMLCCDGMVWRKKDNKFYVADMLVNGVQVIDMDGKVTTLHKNGDTNGADGSLDQPCEVLVRGDELIVINMDMPWESDTLTNKKIDKPYTISSITLPGN